jgi:hypothetical protein
MSARYAFDTTVDVALAAAADETLLNAINAANKTLKLIEFGVSFDGTSATAEPVMVELGYCTQATAGTSTTATITQIGGATRTPGFSAQRVYTVEPTVITPFMRWLVRADGGLLVIQFPLGREVENNATADGLTLTCNAPATVNAQAYMIIEEG